MAEIEVIVETPRGKQSWPLAEVRYQEKDEYMPSLWLEPDLPIALPMTKNCQLWQSRHAQIVFRSRVTPIGRYESWET